MWIRSYFDINQHNISIHYPYYSLYYSKQKDYCTMEKKAHEM